MTTVLVALAVIALVVAHRRRCVVLAAEAAHELRGPLSAALLAVDGLEPSARATAIALELRRAGLALDDLAAAPRGRRAAERAVAFDLGELLREAEPAWNALAGANRVVLAIEPAVVVHGDRLRIAQACGNLVANAIEHGGGEIRVRVRAEAGAARVEVTDSGPGLPAPVGDLLTAARGRRSTRGHGLVLAAGIAERHGGRLSAAPSPHGARLVLELPRAEPRPRAPRLWSTAPEPAT